MARAVAGGTSLGIHHQLSLETSEVLTKMGETLAALQEQFDTLVGVALQNQRALDLRTASGAGTRLYLKGEHCFSMLTNRARSSKTFRVPGVCI